jgi:hypothetical protein
MSFHPEIIEVVACCFGNWERPPDEKRAGGFFSLAYRLPGAIDILG